MNYGRLKGDAYRRSVAKVIEVNKDKDGCFITQAAACGKNAAARAYVAAVNDAAALGAKEADLAVSLSLIVPEKLREIKARELLAEAVDAAERAAVPISDAQVNVLPGVTMPIAVCILNSGADIKQKKAEAGEYIVMTKWIGLEGTSVIAADNASKLSERYPADIVDTAVGFYERYGLVCKDAFIAAKAGASFMLAAREGGIFGALWELADINGKGLTVDLKSIPVRQETIEVCEYFDINPYELMAGGSLLVACPDGEGMVRALEAEGIPAAVIGQLTDGSERIVRRGEEIRFLEPAKGDEIYMILGSKGHKTNACSRFSDFGTRVSRGQILLTPTS